MRTNLETELFIKSKKVWGLASQISMVAEEAAELSAAAMHLNRDIKDKSIAWENFAEEIADLELMLAEMRYYFPDLDSKVLAYRQKKVQKLDNILLTLSGKVTTK